MRQQHQEPPPVGHGVMDGPLDWALEVKRKPGSEDVAVRLLGCVLDTVGADRELAAALRHITGRVCRFVTQLSTGPRYDLFVTLTAAHCTVTCSEHQDPMAGPFPPRPASAASPDETALLRELTAGACGVEIPGLLIQHTPYVAVCVSCRARPVTRQGARSGEEDRCAWHQPESTSV